MKVNVFTVSPSQIISCEKSNIVELICSQLYKNGFDVVSNTSLRLEPKQLVSNFKNVLDNSDCVLFFCEPDFEKSYVCKKIVADYFNVPLVVNEFAKKNLQEFLKTFNVPERKEDSTFVQLPQGSRCVKNPLGVFQGFLLEKDGKILFFLPLNHTQLYHMFFSSALPYLLSKRATKTKTYVLKTIGAKQRELESLLRDFIKNKFEIEIVCSEYMLCGEVVIRVPIGIKQEIEGKFISGLYSKLLPFIYCDHDESLVENIFNLLSVTNKKIVFCEDFTCGNMAKTFFEDVENAKDAVTAAFVVPDNKSKINVLGVDEKIFSRSTIDFGDIAYQMAICAMSKTGADVVVATTGDIKSGSFAFCVGTNEGIHVFEQHLEGTNQEKVRTATNLAFGKLLKKMKQNNFHIGQTVV